MKTKGQLQAVASLPRLVTIPENWGHTGKTEVTSSDSLGETQSVMGKVQSGQ